MIYLFLAEGFEETEAITPADILRRCRKELRTVGVGAKTITSSHGFPIVCDITDDEISLDDELEMVILPGGLRGTENLENSEIVKKTLEFCRDNDRYIAAICAAPRILGHMGLLEGKKAVCYRGFEKELYGADVQSCAAVAAVADGKIITARGAGASAEFGLKIVETLISSEKAAEIADGILFSRS